MAKGQQIKRRIRSISSMLQVTKAMELISSIKMRKAQEAALRSKHYVFESWKSIMRLSDMPENKGNIYLKEQTEGKVLIFVISSDKGLAGSFNSDVMRLTLKTIEHYGVGNVDFITMGSRIRKFLQKIGANIVADFAHGETIVRFAMISPIALIGYEGFGEGKYRKFITIHTHFESTAKMNASSLQILPINPSLHQEFGEETGDLPDFQFEPSAGDVMEKIVRQSIRALTYQVILESEAAEHAARMIAMKNASDAASDLKDYFQFTYNQLRQNSITSELAEISAGVNAME
jgi:F-type H+-transporting ATPase subunit gamma